MAAGRNRLLLLLNSLAPYGAEHFVLNHARYADRGKFDVTVAYIGRNEALLERFQATGARMVGLGERWRPSPLAATRLAKLLVSERIDIVQTHIAYAGVLGRVVGRATRVPVIVCTEQTVRRDLKPNLRWLVEKTFPLAHEHVFITQAVVRSFAQAFPHLLETPQTVITNGIDTEEILRLSLDGRDEVRAELGILADQFAFVNVARLVAQKGQATAIEALAGLRTQGANASLWIVGSGPLKDDLAAKAKVCGVKEHVHLLGQRLDVHRLLAGFDAYVHPATMEALGIAILEAMAGGLPTVASDVDGIPEFVIDGETGWLCKPGDADSVKIKMGQAMEDSARSVGRAGQTFVQQNHDVRSAVAAYERVYATALGRVRTASSS